MELKIIFYMFVEHFNNLFVFDNMHYAEITHTIMLHGHVLIINQLIKIKTLYHFDRYTYINISFLFFLGSKYKYFL